MSKTAAVLVAFLLLCFVVPMSAQLLPNGGNIYVGALYGKSDIVTNYYGFKGFEGSFEGLPFRNLPYLGLVVDGSGLYRPGISQYDMLFGPRLSIQKGNWRPFVQGMGGAERITSAGESHIPVAWDVGGGADYRLPKFWFFPRFAWRIQGDYTHSRMLSASQKEIHVSTGLVWRF